MRRIRLFSASGLALALAVPGVSAPARAQEVVMPPTPNADRLAQEIRVLTEDPQDLRALLSAGALSVRLNDPAAALAFFARAEAVEPNDPRILAGRAAALALLQRPGEALHLFARAEAAGVPPVRFARDRGFAYDLLGAQALAQRDYRLALEQEPDDETIRRLALSLGISGEAEEAMALLDPLLRRSDGAAWRARAFVMAMNGDVAGAERIAENVLPGNMGLALTPFFRRLAELGPADRAFAVHFGEISATPERLADAQLAPPLPRVAAAPPATFAQAGPQPAPAARSDRNSRRRAREAARQQRRQQQQSAPRGSAVRVAPAPSPAPAPAPTPAAPPEPVPAQTAAPTPAPAPAPAPVRAVAEEPATPAAAMPEREAPVTGAARQQPASPPAATPTPTPTPTPTLTPTPAATPRAERPAARPAARPDPRVEEPARYWVQVAGGADESALPFTWRRLVREAPEAFRGMQAWTTPLRATNRLLVGPFANAREAQAFVNQLAAEQIDAFTFQSEAGQRIRRLPTR
ncbi:SPOR domain-containing protein [Sphingosinithalassobacter sp. CS137]|uniref:SPOR domain-containing protein n=1 Tax=Sphingosinithalassobacter sp. CS137 TaxID=2762748 RepID=UPI00165EA355|nr:SPOR domain-containing protein [Sphingosinithalassobacter sp. CS137]